MGKFTRGGYAVLAAGAMVLTPLSAFADVDNATEIDVDHRNKVVCDAGDGNRDGSECGPDIYRFAGPDRVATAIEAAQRTKGVWGNQYGKTAIIANTEVFADALAATPLADELDAPVLLSAPGNQIDGRVINYLVSNNFDTAIIVGGDGVFQSGVPAQLVAAGLNSVRISGASRYQTAVQLAGAAIAVDSTNDKALKNSNVFVASGQNFPDALVSGAAAANHSGVVVLVHETRGLDEMTYNFIKGEAVKFEFDLPTPWGTISAQNNHHELIAVGGPAERGMNTVGAGNTVLEPDWSVVGKNRYETAVMVNQAYVGDASRYVIASGEKFPDAVVGGGYAANVDGGLLLTKEASLPQVVEDFFTQSYKRETINQLFVFGGTGSVSKNVTAEIQALPWDY